MWPVQFHRAKELMVCMRYMRDVAELVPLALPVPLLLLPRHGTDMCIYVCAHGARTNIVNNMFPSSRSNLWVGIQKKKRYGMQQVNTNREN